MHPTHLEKFTFLLALQSKVTIDWYDMVEVGKKYDEHYSVTGSKKRF
jgi:hypothetical protein